MSDRISVSSDSDDQDIEIEDEEFEDAQEKLEAPADMDLHAAIEDTMINLNLFLNNKFSEAKKRMEPWKDCSYYQALGYGTIMYLQAVMTFEMSDIEAATTAVKQALHVCNKFRRKTSMVSLSKHNYDSYTADELHAEVCYAECLLERALLTFIQDENLISFVKGSLKIRACYHSYKETLRMLERRHWKNEDEKIHFESGVRMGVGIFNLMISLLPTKIMRLLEIIGFSGNKKKGLAELEAGANLEKTIRGPLCSMAVMGYHTVVTHVLGTADGDVDFAAELLKPCLKKYPKGAMFLFFAGRIEEIKGNLERAILRFEESIDSQAEWRQFHHLCFWELMWCHCFHSDWLLAMKYAERLCKESKWSKATYTYQKVSFLLMCDDQTEETFEHIKYLFLEIPRLKQRIAGKSIPIEKFAVKKAKRFTEQGCRLVLPAYELIYVWNGFSIIGKRPELIKPMLIKVEETLNETVKTKGKAMFYEDDYCLVLLLKGMCLRCNEQLFQAEQCFREVCEYDKKLKQDNYLIPCAMYELAMLNILNNKVNEATILLNKAKNNHKGYSLESRLHFRIHAANMQIKAMTSPESSVAGGEDLLPDLSPSNSAGKTTSDANSTLESTHL